MRGQMKSVVVSENLEVLDSKTDDREDWVDTFIVFRIKGSRFTVGTASRVKTS